jgi:hypothetical protein
MSKAGKQIPINHGDVGCGVDCSRNGEIDSGGWSNLSPNLAVLCREVNHQTQQSAFDENNVDALD